MLTDFPAFLLLAETQQTDALRGVSTPTTHR